MTHPTCPICSATMTVVEPELSSLLSITSDCRPWHAGRAIALCPQDGLMERVVRSEAKAVFDNVYDDYAMFKHSSVAADQISFDAQGGGEGRTQKILRFVAEKLPQAPVSVLDIGSGSGAGLLALSHQFPQAQIYGFEPNDHPQKRQAFLPANVASIFNKRPPVAERQYDLVTMFHVFEHIEDVFEVLEYTASILSPSGHLLIEVPYPLYNPFDFTIADHIRHFSIQSLCAMLAKANYTVVYAGNDVLKKELTVMARPGNPKAVSLNKQEAEGARHAMQWLLNYNRFLESVKALGVPLLVFGTGPAAAWVGHVLGEAVSAYLDEDATRVGSTFNGKPVVALANANRALPVIAPFPDYQVEWIAERNKDLNILKFSDSPYARAQHKASACA